MKSYNQLKTEMVAIQQQMVEAKKNECANALKRSKAPSQRIRFYCRDALRRFSLGREKN